MEQGSKDGSSDSSTLLPQVVLGGCSEETTPADLGPGAEEGKGTVGDPARVQTIRSTVFVENLSTM